MRERLAAILREQIPVAHPTVLHLRVPLHQNLLNHLNHLKLRNQLARIVIVAARIFQRAVVQRIGAGRLARYRKGVKPVIHAGFDQSL
jgi:hypothetical protein